MIYRDEAGYIVDRTGDGGDTAERMGVAALTNLPLSVGLKALVFADGSGVRHPTQTPWNNPRNFSRDQLIALSAGLHATGLKEAAKRLYYRQLKGLGFAQNWERDYPGTTKHPWPTWVAEENSPFKTLVLFDSADPLSPADYWHLARCAGHWSQWLWYFAGLPTFVMELAAHCKLAPPDAEDNQTIAKCAIVGPWALRLFKRWKPNYEQNLQAYWNVERNMVEFADALITLVEGSIKHG